MDRNEAIEIVKNNWPHGRYQLAEALETLIPELRESEDELMRKEAIAIIKQYNIICEREGTKCYTADRVISWLEKQGKKSNIPQSAEDNLRRQHIIQVLEYARSLDAYNQFGKERINKDIAWLKKQAEILESIKHKEAMLDCQTCKNYKNECFPDRNIFKCSYPIKHGEKNPPQDVDEKQSEQNPGDKLETKFNVGDWLQYRNAKPFLVEEITKQGYVNGDSCLPFNWENEIHLWTIQDAKDGDVLVASDGSIFILKEIVGCGCKHYIALEKDKETISVNDNLKHFWEAAGGVKPATKEQRDLLFQKMKESGYEWDAEKKELKEISQEYPLTSNECCKPAWSEEDETFTRDAVAAAEEYYTKGCGQEELVVWLKSLKDRVQPQSNQEWNEYDKIQLSEAIQMIEANGTWIRSEDAVKKVSNWLKSLKQRMKGEQL